MFIRTLAKITEQKHVTLCYLTPDYERNNNTMENHEEKYNYELLPPLM